MKIGTFARKFNTNISTVRFYINNGLLAPGKTGGQYEFDKECVADMAKILKYKKYYFALEEIQLLFFMEKASRFQDEIVVDVCADILKNKKKQLIIERDNLTEFIDEIEKEIGQLVSNPTEYPSKDGVPFSIIPSLYCPGCQEALRLDSASLSNGSIQKGILSCECGYTADIDDGILRCGDFTEETPFKAFENVESVMAMKDQFSANYRGLIAKTYLWMYHQMTTRLEGMKYIMAGPFTFNFLLEYIEKLGKNYTYIIFDPSLKRIRKIKRYLSSWDYSIVYIVGMPTELPLKRGTVDFYIDDYSTVNSMFTYNTFSTESITPLLKASGEVVGIFTNYQNAPKSIRNFNKDHPDFKAERMTLGGLKYHWSLEGVKIISEKNIGTTTSSGIHFPQHAAGETIDVHGYRAKKDPR